MADEPEGTELSEADVESFTQKLEDWGATLSPGERGMLHLLLARAEAGAAEEEVGGYDLGRLAIDVPRQSPSLRANDLLRPMVAGGGLFFDAAPVGAGTWSSWGRG
jgi:hypothetical protein